MKGARAALIWPGLCFAASGFCLVKALNVDVLPGLFLLVWLDEIDAERP